MEEVQHSLQKQVFFFIAIAFVLLLALPGRLNVQAETNIGNAKVSEWLNEEDKQTTERITEQPTEEGQAPIEEEQQLGNEEIPTFESTFTWWDVVKIFGAFFIVIVLIYLLLRFINQRNRFANEGKLMQNIGGIALGTNKSVQLVKIGERIYVVGVGENISLLKEIDNEEEVATIMEANEVKGFIPSTGGFKQLFSMQKRNEDGEHESSFQSILKSQLDAFAEGRRQLYEKFKKEHKS